MTSLIGCCTELLLGRNKHCTIAAFIELGLVTYLGVICCTSKQVPSPSSHPLTPNPLVLSPRNGLLFSSPRTAEPWGSPEWFQAGISPAHQPSSRDGCIQIPAWKKYAGHPAISKAGQLSVFSAAADFRDAVRTSPVSARSLWSLVVNHPIPETDIKLDPAALSSWR